MLKIHSGGPSSQQTVLTIPANQLKQLGVGAGAGGLQTILMPVGKGKVGAITGLGKSPHVAVVCSIPQGLKQKHNFVFLISEAFNTSSCLLGAFTVSSFILLLGQMFRTWILPLRLDLAPLIQHLMAHSSILCACVCSCVERPSLQHCLLLLFLHPWSSWSWSRHKSCLPGVPLPCPASGTR